MPLTGTHRFNCPPAPLQQIRREVPASLVPVSVVAMDPNATRREELLRPRPLRRTHTLTMGLPPAITSIPDELRLRARICSVCRIVVVRKQAVRICVHGQLHTAKA